MMKVESTARNPWTELLAVIGYIAILPFQMAWSGYVFVALWGWFIVPFFQMPVLGIAQAIGLLLVARYMTSQYVKNPNDPPWGPAMRGFLVPALFLLFGWLLNRWAM